MSWSSWRARFFELNRNDDCSPPCVEVNVILEASTSEVYGVELRACYDEGKRCAETLFLACHRCHSIPPIRVPRIFNTHGPHMHPNDGRVVSNFIMQAIHGDSITVYADGCQTRSFCYVDDMIERLVVLMDAPDEVTGPVPVDERAQQSADGRSSQKTT
jgi:UDP-glucuronate decarboxylase